MEEDLKSEKPFYRKHLESNLKSIVMSFRVNEEEQAMIQRLRKMLDVEAEGKAIKIAFKVGYFVLQNTFGEKLLAYLSSTKRERKSDYEGRGKSSKEDSVIQKEPDL
jgi:hypothetical protein